MAITGGQAGITIVNKVNVEKAVTSLNPTTSQQGYQTALAMNTIGAGAGAFDQAYTAVRTLVGAASEDLDLYGGLTNVFGETINFVRIKAISIELLATTAASSITVGAAASHAWLGPLGGTTPTITIRNGGFYATGCTDATGFPVANGTTDVLKINNDDAAITATYRITLVGSTS